VNPSGGAIGGARGGGRPPPLTAVLFRIVPLCTKYGIYLHNLQNYANILNIGNSILGDDLAIAQQLVSDILTCFGADVLNRAPLASEAPHKGSGGLSPPLWGRQEAPNRGAP